MQGADALSRATATDQSCDTAEIVMTKHIEWNHRKCIEKDLKEIGIVLSKEELKKILSKCEICARKDTQVGKTCKYVEVEQVGDLVGLDILEMTEQDKIIIMIDYFSRKVMARKLETKEATKTINFIKDCYEQMPFNK